MGNSTIGLSKLDLVIRDKADRLIIRHATHNDDIAKMAQLLYESDKYIFPYWFNNNVEEGISTLSEMILAPGCYFYLDNIWVAEISGRICGVLLIFDSRSHLFYQYDKFKDRKPSYHIAISQLIEANIPKMISLPDGTAFGAYMAIDPEMRRHKIATRLYGGLIYNLENCGYERFEHYCLKENLAALQLYDNLGFKHTKEIDGFPGNSNEPVKAVVLERQKGNMLPIECIMSATHSR